MARLPHITQSSVAAEARKRFQLDPTLIGTPLAIGIPVFVAGVVLVICLARPPDDVKLLPSLVPKPKPNQFATAKELARHLAARLDGVERGDAIRTFDFSDREYPLAHEGRFRRTEPKDGVTLTFSDHQTLKIHWSERSQVNYTGPTDSFMYGTFYIVGDTERVGQAGKLLGVKPVSVTRNILN